MCPSQTPEKSGTPSEVRGTFSIADDFSAFAPAFGAVCAHNPEEKATAVTRAKVRPSRWFRISANPPVVRNESSRRTTLGIAPVYVNGKIAAKIL
jgi:hypothetical protein